MSGGPWLPRARKDDPVYLSRVRVRGLRGSVDHPLEVSLPGRFTVIAGANGGGKTTFSDAVYLGHPSGSRTCRGTPLRRSGQATATSSLSTSSRRTSADEGPLGMQLQAQSGRSVPGTVAADWARTMHRSMGAINTKVLTASTSGVEDKILLVHLPAWRNPLDELSRREARVLVELLRAQQQNRGRGRDLSDLRAHASRLLEQLATHEVLEGPGGPGGGAVAGALGRRVPQVALHPRTGRRRPLPRPGAGADARQLRGSIGRAAAGGRRARVREPAPHRRHPGRHPRRHPDRRSGGSSSSGPGSCREAPQQPSARRHSSRHRSSSSLRSRPRKSSPKPTASSPRPGPRARASRTRSSPTARST